MNIEILIKIDDNGFSQRYHRPHASNNSLDHDTFTTMIFSPVVIAPTYNNEKTLDSIVRRIKMLGLPLIVINDGSTDQTAEVLAAARTEFVDDASLLVLTHPRNCGKATALRSGFQAATDRGYSHAVTIDTDGQHDPEQIPQLLRIGQDDPTTLLLGVRTKAIEGYPARSMLGRRLSNLLVWLESRVWVQDSQCGLRLYPLELIRRVSCRTNRFNFETEIITRAAWAKWRITEVPITSRYFPPEQRIRTPNRMVFRASDDRSKYIRW